MSAIIPRFLQIKESATLAINQKVKTLRSQGKNIVQFAFGEAPFPIHPFIVKALQENSHRNHYLPTAGLPELKQLIAHYFNRRGYLFDKETIIIGPGSKELIFDLLMLLDGILILPSPCWVSYTPQAQIAGKEIHYIETKIDDRFNLTAEALEKKIKEFPQSQPKILLLNSPNNPTGTAQNKQQIQEIADVCRKYCLTVIADEIYAEVYYNESIAPSIAHFYPEGTIVTSGMSKAFAAGGYRLGFVALPSEKPQLKQALLSFVSETFSCVATPIQYAACVAYSDNEEINNYVKNCASIYSLISKFISHVLNTAGIKCLQGQGGFYLFPVFNTLSDCLQQKKISNSQQLCELLLKEANVAMLPANEFFLSEKIIASRLCLVDFDGKNVYENFIQGKSTIEELLPLIPNIQQGAQNIAAWLKD